MEPRSLGTGMQTHLSSKTTSKNFSEKVIIFESFRDEKDLR